jgi:ATP-dependent DNA helicase RecG
MSIEAIAITEEQVLRILAIEEGHFADHKDRRIAPSKLTESVSGFANADGGDLYIGVHEESDKTHTWDGFPMMEDANAHLQVFENLFPLGRYFGYEFLTAPNRAGYVLHVQIQKTPGIIKASDGVPYVRRGAQKLPCKDAEALRRLELNKGLISFENEIVAAANPVDIMESSVLADFMKHVIPTTESVQWLKKQYLIRDEHPTVAGMVLFAEEPQATLPKRCSIKIYRYKSQDASGSRDTLAGNPATIEGCAYNQIYAAVKVAKGMIQGIQKLGTSGLEDIEYPDETLHEIITNAVLHRDYSIADDVHVRIFDNRVEVESPGRLPGHVTVKNILEERYARNGNIVRIINKFPNPPNKDVGEGLNTAFDAMKKLRLVAPEIQQRDNSVIVLIKHEPLASPESIIIDYLTVNTYINNGTARTIYHIPEERAIRNILKGLERTGEIERTPGTNTASTTYRLKKKKGLKAKGR